MVAYTFRMPSGIPGTVTRPHHSTIEPELMLSSAPLTAYGLPCIRDAATGKMRVATTGDTVSMVAGFLVRPYPTNGVIGGSQALGVSVPDPGAIANVLKRGYTSVLLGGSTSAVKGGPVYLRIATPGTGKPIGGVEAAADGANTIQLNAVFQGPADAQGVTEIGYNI